MAVPKNKRKPSPFQTPIEMMKLRDEVTAMLFKNFGYSDKRFEKQVERFRKMHEKSCKNIDEVVENFKIKQRAIHEWYIERERNIIHTIVQRIDSEFKQANSIYPSKTPAFEQEYIERRIHLDKAIASCYELIGELEHIVRTLPVDKNKFCSLEDAIDNQIKLFKGVRKSDNRFLKEIRKQEGKNTNDK